MPKPARPTAPGPEAVELRRSGEDVAPELLAEISTLAHPPRLLGVFRAGELPPFELRPDAHEVDEVFEVPLSFLLDPHNHQRHSRVFEGQTRWFYAIPYRDYYIWGATAGMLVNLYRHLCYLEASPRPSVS